MGSTRRRLEHEAHTYARREWSKDRRRPAERRSFRDVDRLVGRAVEHVEEVREQPRADV